MTQHDLDLDMVDWSNIQTAIDALKRRENVTVLGLTKLIQDITKSNESLKELFDDSWPDQEIAWYDSTPAGIPLELAKLVLAILRFCADTNINLVSAIELWLKEGPNV